MPDINRDVSIEQVDYEIDVNNIEYSIEINPQQTFELQLNEQGPQGLTGPQGETGDTGNGISSITQTGTSGLIDTYTIYYTDGDTTTFDVTNGKDGVDGKDGRDGVDGQAATISVGTVSTGAAGTSASVVNSGTSSAAVFDFTIPRGDKGDTGNTGATGISVTGVELISTVGLVKTYRMSFSDGSYFDYTVSDGASGSTTWGGITGVLSNQTDLQNALNAKQDKAVYVTYGTTTFAEITQYVANGNLVYCIRNDVVYRYTGTINNNHYFGALYTSNYTSLACSSSNTWSSQAGTIQTLNAAIKTGETKDATNYNYYSALKTDELLAAKQDTLVSGTNIKTINGTSVLGSGDITIQSAPDIDNKSITTNLSDELQTVGVIDQNNTTNAIKTWTGTKAQYDAIVTKDANTIYNITDDTDVTLTLLDALYPVGAIYIGTMANCPLQVLGVGTWILKTANAIVTGVNATAPVKGNGMTLGLTNGTDYRGFDSNSSSLGLTSESYGKPVGYSSSSRNALVGSLGITTDSTKSGIEATVTSTSLTVNIWERTA